jgi:hypothetical protein
MGAGASSAHLAGGGGGGGGGGLLDGDSAAYENATDEQKALMAQAQAHWRRMIIHANTVEKAGTGTGNSEGVGGSGSRSGSSGVNKQRSVVSEEARVQNTIAMYRASEEAERVHDHKADDVGGEGIENFDKELQARLAPLDEQTLITRSNSDIVLKRSASGEPLPFAIPRSPSIRASKSSTSLQDQLRSDDVKPINSPQTSVDSAPPVIARSTSSSQVASFRQQSKISSATLEAISALPPVRIDLRSRTGSSLSLVWDTDMEALIRLRKVVDRDGSQIAPRYEVTYRKTQHKSDFEALYDRSIQENKSSKWQWMQLDDESRTSGTISQLQANTQYCVRCRRMQVH